MSKQNKIPKKPIYNGRKNVKYEYILTRSTNIYSKLKTWLKEIKEDLNKQKDSP